jgi:Flp pilus assembly pilin Flp
MWQRVRALWLDESGPTAVEYAIMLAAITGVIVAIVIVFGAKVNQTFGKVTNAYP